MSQNPFNQQMAGQWSGTMTGRFASKQLSVPTSTSPSFQMELPIWLDLQLRQAELELRQSEVEKQHLREEIARLQEQFTKELAHYRRMLEQDAAMRGPSPWIVMPDRTLSSTELAKLKADAKIIEEFEKYKRGKK